MAVYIMLLVLTYGLTLVQKENKFAITYAGFEMIVLFSTAV